MLNHWKRLRQDGEDGLLDLPWGGDAIQPSRKMGAIPHTWATCLCPSYIFPWPWQGRASISLVSEDSGAQRLDLSETGKVFYQISHEEEVLVRFMGKWKEWPTSMAVTDNSWVCPDFHTLYYTIAPQQGLKTTGWGGINSRGWDNCFSPGWCYWEGKALPRKGGCCSIRGWLNVEILAAVPLHLSPKLQTPDTPQTTSVLIALPLLNVRVSDCQ